MMVGQRLGAVAVAHGLLQPSETTMLRNRVGTYGRACCLGNSISISKQRRQGQSDATVILTMRVAGNGRIRSAIAILRRERRNDTKIRKAHVSVGTTFAVF